MHEADVQEHFGTLETQRHAAVLGMWVFLASEVLLFTVLLTVYAIYRIMHPVGFAEGIAHNIEWLGSINTFILLLSSYLVAHSVADLRGQKRGLATALLLLAVFLGVSFLGLKLAEYIAHFQEGIYPGGRGAFFQTHDERGLVMFFTLYYLTTGAHAFHVIVGLGVLLAMAWKVYRQRIGPNTAHVLETGTMYWHLVDIVWLVLWPLFYLTGGGAT